jgi:hypothetical protein
MHDNIVEYIKLLLKLPSLTAFATVYGNADRAGEEAGVVIFCVKCLKGDANQFNFKKMNINVDVFID